MAMSAVDDSISVLGRVCQLYTLLIECMGNTAWFAFNFLAASSLNSLESLTARTQILIHHLIVSDSAPDYMSYTVLYSQRPSAPCF